MKKYVYLVLLLLVPALCYGLNIVAPNAGERIPTGSLYKSIPWSPSAGATQFNILFSADNGLAWSLQNNTGKVIGTTFDWAVPLMTKNKTQCLIKVIGFDNLGTKVEVGKSAAFTINVLNVTFPDALTDVLDAGHIETVTWNTVTPATVTDATLYYTVDGGITWLPITTIAGNPGTYDWTVPQFSTDKSAKLKVILMNGATKVAADTSGTFMIDASPKTVASADGTYYLPYLDFDYSSPLLWNSHEQRLEMNGAGLLDVFMYVASKNPPSDPELDLPYTVSPDGQIVVAGRVRGVISDDNNLILFAEPRKNVLGIGLAIKPSSGLSNATLSGDYIMGQVGNGWTGRFTVTFDGAGSGNVHCEDMTGSCQFTDVPFTYAVDALTGQVSDSLGHQGIVSGEGQVFSITDFNSLDGTLSIAVGIKKSSDGSSNATATGKFLAATFGLSDTHGPWVDVFQVKLNGAGEGTATELYTSWPPLTPAHPVIYSVGVDGLLGLGPTGTEVQGIVMENGQGFLAVDTRPGHSSLTLGLKKAK